MKISLISLFLFSAVCQAQDEEYEQYVLRASLPDGINYSSQNEAFFSKYKIRKQLNPFYQRGDFNGDGDMDYAISIIEHSSNKSGIAVFFSENSFEIIGAGMQLANRDIDDFSWMDAWQIYSESDVELGVGETEKLSLTADALLIIKTESASGIIYWDGSRFMWYQQGD